MCYAPVQQQTIMFFRLGAPPRWHARPGRAGTHLSMERAYLDHPIVRRVGLMSECLGMSIILKFEIGLVFLSRFVKWWRTKACKICKSDSGAMSSTDWLIAADNERWEMIRIQNRIQMRSFDTSTFSLCFKKTFSKLTRRKYLAC